MPALPAVVDRGARGHIPPGAIQISHKKMATKFGRIHFMFLGPHLYLATGSATGQLMCYHGKTRCFSHISETVNKD